MKRIIVIILMLFSFINSTLVFANDIESTIRQGIENCQTTIDVSEFNVDSKIAISSFLEIIKENPEYFFVKTKVKCKYLKETHKATRLIVNYNESVEIASAKFTALNKKADEVVAAVAGMTKTEQAKAVHDYLIANCSYDQTYTKRTAYDALVEGVGVCKAYALAYKLIMNRLDIPCYVIVSDSMNHAWNQIKINDKWLHVDTTWDDPIINGNNANTTPYYDYFLKSDIEFLDHYDWRIR